jgi:hypothetical protein
MLCSREPAVRMTAAQAPALPVTALAATAAAGSDEKKAKSSFMEIYTKGSVVFTNLFPLWLTIFSGVALKDPSMFAW